ncbi:MAG: hypothetical protein PSX81_02760 [bacterium]|nr:hypothetical protein [bacterium]
MAETKKKHYVTPLEDVAENQRKQNGDGMQLFYRKNNTGEYVTPEGSELEFPLIDWKNLSAKELGISDFPAETPGDPKDINPK